MYLFTGDNELNESDFNSVISLQKYYNSHLFGLKINYFLLNYDLDSILMDSH